MSDFSTVCEVFKGKNIFTPSSPTDEAKDKASCCARLNAISENDRKYLMAFVIIQEMEDYFLSKPESVIQEIRDILYNEGIDKAKQKAQKKKDAAAQQIVQEMEDYFLNQPEELPNDIKQILYDEGIDKAKEAILKLDFTHKTLSAAKVSTSETLQKIAVVWNSDASMPPAEAIKKVLAAVEAATLAFCAPPPPPPPPSAPTIVEITPRGAFFPDGEELPIRVKVRDVEAAKIKYLDIQDKDRKSVLVGGTALKLTDVHVREAGGIVVIGTFAADDPNKQVRIAIKKETPPTGDHSYHLVLLDADNNELTHIEVNIVNPFETEGKTATDYLREGYQKVAFLNPELKVGLGVSNYGIYNDKVKGEHPVTYNYPKADFERIPNWDVTLGVAPEFRLFEGNLQVDPEFHLKYQKFHNFESGDSGTSRFNVGFGTNVSTNLAEKIHLVPDLRLTYDFKNNEEQYPSLTHPSGDENTFALLLQFNKWKFLKYFNENRDWLTLRPAIWYEATKFRYWKETLGFGFVGGVKKLKVGGGFDLLANDIWTKWYVPNLSFDVKMIASGYRDVPDSLVGRYRKAIEGCEFSTKLAFPKEAPWTPYLGTPYLDIGYQEEQFGGHLKLIHRSYELGLSPPKHGQFILTLGFKNENPYYFTTVDHGKLRWIPPKNLWYLPEFEIGGAYLNDRKAHLGYREFYGTAIFDIIRMIKKEDK